MSEPADTIDLDMSIFSSPSLREGLIRMVNQYASRNCIGQCEGEEIRWYTFADMYQKALHLANDSRFRDRKAVGILLPNGVEWVVCDWACVLRDTCCSVGISLSFDIQQASSALRDSEVSLLICCDSTLPKATQIMETLDGNLQLLNITEFDFDAENNASEELEVSEHDDSTDIFTIIFTSGSTGNPKGAIVSKKTWRNGLDLHLQFSPISTPTVIVGLEPLSYMGGRASQWAAMASGGQIGYPNPRNDDGASDDTLFKDIAHIRPTELDAPPRLFSVLQRAFGETRLTWPDEAPEATRKRFSGVFGDRCSSIATGGAAVPQSLLKFLEWLFPDTSIGVGYGATECGGITDDGCLVAGVRVKILDIPELGYHACDKPWPRGEICVNSPTMVDGYLQSKENDKFFEEYGILYYKTGDIGELQHGNYINLLGRIGTCFKLSQAEFVNPERLEGIYTSGSLLISDCFIYGDGQHDTVVAVVGCNSNENANAKEEEILKELSTIGAREKLNPWEIPRRVEIVSPFREYSDSLFTDSGKLRRSVARRLFEGKAKALYGDNSRHSMAEEVVNALKSLGFDADINSNDPIYSVFRGDDSLKAYSLHSMLIDRFGFELDIHLLSQQELTTVDLVSQISGNENGSIAGAEAGPVRIENQVDLDLDLVKRDWATFKTPPPHIIHECDKDKSAKKWKCVILTGATGFLGRHLLQALIDSGCCDHIVCITRRNLGSRFKQEIESGKIVVFECDLAIERLKLREKLKELSSRSDMCISAVYHAASIVSWIESYSSLRRVNVHATYELLKLCLDLSIPFHHVSSLGMFYDLNVKVTESLELQLSDVMAMEEGDGYNQSKGLADMLVIEYAKAHKLNATIHRPGLIGPSTTGDANMSDFVTRMLHAMIRERRGIDDDSIFDVIPVDYVAKGILNSTLSLQFPIGDGGCTYKIFNHVYASSGSPTLRQISEILLKNNFVDKMQSWKEWRDAVLISIENDEVETHAHPLKPLRLYISDLDDISKLVPDCEVECTMSAISAFQSTKNIFDEEYFLKVISQNF